MSTVGLLLLLQRWCQASKTSLRHCKFGCALSRDLLEQALHRCWFHGGSHDEWQIRVVVDDCHWRPSWPRPEPLVDGCNVIGMDVDSTGVVDWSMWLKASSTSRPAARQRSAILTFAETFDGLRVPLTMLSAFFLQSPRHGIIGSTVLILCQSSS